MSDDMTKSKDCFSSLTFHCSHKSINIATVLLTFVHLYTVNGSTIFPPDIPLPGHFHTVIFPPGFPPYELSRGG